MSFELYRGYLESIHCNFSSVYSYITLRLHYKAHLLFIFLVGKHNFYASATFFANNYSLFVFFLNPWKVSLSYLHRWNMHSFSSLHLVTIIHSVHWVDCCLNVAHVIDADSLFCSYLIQSKNAVKKVFWHNQYWHLLSRPPDPMTAPERFQTRGASSQK